jgi:hypothetical protein
VKGANSLHDDTCRPGVSAAGCTSIGDLVKSQPPQPFDCRVPQKWRNTRCVEGAMPGDPIARQGTELDWLGFYTAWRWGTGDPERDSNVVEFSDTYVEACGGVSCALPANVTFEGTATTGSLRLAGLGVLGGGIGTNPKYLQFFDSGRDYGVSTDISP